MWAEFFITLECRAMTQNPEAIKQKTDKYLKFYFVSYFIGRKFLFFFHFY